MPAGSPTTQVFGRDISLASPVALRADTSVAMSIVLYHGGARLLGRGVVVKWSPLQRTNWGLDLDTAAANISQLPDAGRELLRTSLPTGWSAYTRLDSSTTRYARELWLVPPSPRNVIHYVSVGTCGAAALPQAQAIVHSVSVLP